MILDIENPDRPKIDQVYNAGGCINDLHDVKLGITYVSEFAYLADGKNGLRVVQLTVAGDAGQRRLQPAADAAPDRDLPDPARRPRAVGRQGPRPRPGGGRERQPDRRLRPRRRPAAEPGRAAEAVLQSGRVWTVSDDPNDPMYGQPRK